MLPTNARNAALLALCVQLDYRNFKNSFSIPSPPASVPFFGDSFISYISPTIKLGIFLGNLRNLLACVDYDGPKRACGCIQSLSSEAWSGDAGLFNVSLINPGVVSVFHRQEPARNPLQSSSPPPKFPAQNIAQRYLPTANSVWRPAQEKIFR